MIIVLHGDHIEASRKELQALRDQVKTSEVRYLSGRDIDETSLTQALESNSLFGESVILILERLLSSKGKSVPTIKSITGILSRNAQKSTIIMWEDREISATVLKLLGPTVSVRLFKTPVILFKFLDTLRPNNERPALLLLSQVIKIQAPELVHALLVRRVRHLIMLKDNVLPEGMADWQSSRLTIQAKLFTMEKLRNMHAKLLENEYSLKNGSTPYSMKELLELFVSEV